MDSSSRSKSLSFSESYSGWLYKWTNYFRGYKKRWFVLQNGTLSYYSRNNFESPQCCRGAIFISNSYIHSGESNNFVITNSSSRTYHLKAVSIVEKQKWITALEFSKKNHRSNSDSDEELTSDDDGKMDTLIKDLTCKIEVVKFNNQELHHHGMELRNTLDIIDDKTTSILSEKIDTFWAATNLTIKACNDFLELACQMPDLTKKIVSNEHKQKQLLEEMIVQLGRQQSNFERKVRLSMDAAMCANEPVIDSSEDEFYDSLENFEHLKNDKKKKHRRNISDCSTDNYNSSDTDSDNNENKLNIVHEVLKTKQSKVSNMQEFPQPMTMNFKNHRKYRRSVPERPNYNLPLWSIIKNSIGKELSKIPMPVNFNEPLSFLQRLMEDFEYSYCLDLAIKTTDPYERFALIAAFTVSSYASTNERTFKPFNPLLGETFECDRTGDLGWKSICEQVSHHPPMCAMYVEGQGWISWQEFTMSTKFRGTSMQIVPLGLAHLLITSTGDHYTWRKVTTTVHNIIVGKLWVDNHGEMTITNQKTRDICVLNYEEYSLLSRETPRKVTGIVYDAKRLAHYALDGTWDKQINGSKILSTDETKGKSVFTTSDRWQVLWKRTPPPQELIKCHNFSYFAVSLNQLEPGVAPTDSRLRPDQRLMEEGDWAQANEIKVQLKKKKVPTATLR